MADTAPLSGPSEVGFGTTDAQDAQQEAGTSAAAMESEDTVTELQVLYFRHRYDVPLQTTLYQCVYAL